MSLKGEQSQLALSNPPAGEGHKGVEEKPNRAWSQRVFGCGPSSKLIHPLSRFSLAWLSVTAVLLGYTAIVTPSMIAFHWLDDEVMTQCRNLLDCHTEG